MPAPVFTPFDPIGIVKNGVLIIESAGIRRLFFLRSERMWMSLLERVQIDFFSIWLIMIWLPRLAKSWFWSICKTCVLFKPSQIRQIVISQIPDFVNSITTWFAKRAFFSTKYFHSSFKITATRSWSTPPPISTLNRFNYLLSMSTWKLFKPLNKSKYGPHPRAKTAREVW